jgi:hypothetical protein
MLDGRWKMEDVRCKKSDVRMPSVPTRIGGIFVGIAQLAFRFLYEFHFYPHLLTPQASSPYMQGV